MVDLRTYLAVVLITLIVIIAVSVVVARRMVSRASKAVQFVDEQRKSYRSTAGYQPPSLKLTQQVYRELFAIPPHYFIFSNDADDMWWNIYSLLLECLIAIGAQTETPATLVYGSYRERSKSRSEHYSAFRALFWLEFTYNGAEWALWIDEQSYSESSSDFAKVHCCTTAMFQSQTEAHVLDACPVNIVLKTYRAAEIAVRSEQTSEEPVAKSTSQARRERMREFCEEWIYPSKEVTGARKQNLPRQ